MAAGRPGTRRKRRWGSTASKPIGEESLSLWLIGRHEEIERDERNSRVALHGSDLAGRRREQSRSSGAALLLVSTRENRESTENSRKKKKGRLPLFSLGFFF